MSFNTVQNWKNFANTAQRKIVMAPPNTISTAAVKQENVRPSMQLIKAEAEPEVMVSDQMGIDMITLKVKSDHLTFGTFKIHCGLLSASSKKFQKIITDSANVRAEGRNIHFDETSPDVFRLFVEYLYTRTVPGVPTSRSIEEQAARISCLCQLYVFADSFDMEHVFLNKIMDRIQDGLRVMGIGFSEVLIQQICSYAHDASLLRKLCMATTLYSLIQSPKSSSNSFKWLLTNSEDFFDDFKAYISSNMKHGPDPRVRDFNAMDGNTADFANGSETGGVDISNGVEDQGQSIHSIAQGVHPCKFHIHKRMELSDDNRSTTDGGQYELETCHLMAGQ